MPQITEQEQGVRRVVADALDAMALALSMAAVLVLVLMVGIWVVDSPQPDFPGRYLVAALPMLLAALVLNMRAHRIRKTA